MLHDKRGHVAGVVTNCEHPWAGFCTIFDVGDISSALQQAIMSAVGVGNPPANAPYLMSSLGRWTTSISASPQENCINGYRPLGSRDRKSKAGQGEVRPISSTRKVRSKRPSIGMRSSVGGISQLSVSQPVRAGAKGLLRAVSGFGH